MTECSTGGTWGVLSIGGDNPFGEAPFEIKDSLSIFEAARIASGRHPVPRFLKGEDMAAYWRLLAAGSDRRDVSDPRDLWHKKDRSGERARRRARAQSLRSIAVFHAIMNELGQGKIKPIKLVYLTRPGPSDKGAIDWRYTRVSTRDVARICKERGWRPKLLRPTEELAAEPLAISAPPPPEKPSPGKASPVLAAVADADFPAVDIEFAVFRHVEDDIARVEQCPRESYLPAEGLDDEADEGGPHREARPVLASVAEDEITDFVKSTGCTNGNVAWLLVKAKLPSVKQDRFRALWKREGFGGPPGRRAKCGG